MRSQGNPLRQELADDTLGTGLADGEGHDEKDEDEIERCRRYGLRHIPTQRKEAEVQVAR